MISSTMTPKQINAALTRYKRALEDPPQPPAKRRRVKGKKKQGTTTIASQMDLTRSFQASPALKMTRGPTDAVRIRNQEATTITLQGATTTPFVGRNFFRVAAGPSTTISWLPTIAKQYSMYRFRSVKIRYIPSVGTTESGSLAMGFFPDAEEASFFFSSGSGTGTLAQLSQCRKYAQGPLYSDLEITLTPQDFALDWYYVDPNPTSISESRLTVAGALGLLTTSNATLLNSQVGTLYIEYDVELKFPVTTNPDLS
jgi:hypothetical protein